VPSSIASALSVPKRLDAPPATTTPAIGVLASRVLELDSGGTMLERFLLLSLVLALAASMPAGAQSPRVTMTTSLGKIVIELDQATAPKTVENFLRYVDEKFYDGTIFHRVIPTFMIQGGGFTKDMMQKTTHEQIKNESKNGLSNARGTIAMARLPQPDTATAQFFINVQDNQGLDAGKAGEYGYAVFGKVVEGLDVVDKIKAVKTASAKGHDDVPVEPVVIESIRRN
jgi:cyclophilin family peptidyl-prolyl cis-trans isomerase